MNKIDNTIIIWGNDNYNTLGLLRQLASVGLKVVLVINNQLKACASKSVYAKHIHLSKTLDDGYAFLLNFVTSLKQKPILISTSDNIAEYVDLHSDELSKYYYISGTTQKGLLSNILDKNKMCQLAIETGFDVPYSLRIDRQIDIPSDLKYPVILKPDKKRQNVKTEFKTKICQSREEVISVLSHVSPNSRFILQEYIPKERDILVYGCRLTNGKTILGGVFEKDRWIPEGDGSHGKIYSEIPDYINVSNIESFMNTIDYHGLFSVEYGLCNDTAYFYEVNLRNDGTSHYFFQAGINIPLLWVCDCVGASIELNRIKGVHYFIDEIGDKINIGNTKLLIAQWKKDKREATIFKYYDTNDTKPYYLHLYRKYRSKIIHTIFPIRLFKKVLCKR